MILALSYAMLTAASSPSMPDEAALGRMMARFAPVELKIDLSTLPESERAALAELVRAAQVMDPLFLEQVWAGNPALLVALAGRHDRLSQARLSAFLLDKGPWSRLDGNAQFIPGVPPKPASGSFYPADATKEQIESWANGLSPAERAAAMGFYTVIRRDEAGTLRAVPYSLAYQSSLELAAAHLRRAAELTSDPTLKDFLSKRARAFATNDYYDSDVAWMHLDGALEPTIGPYEVYEDEWLNAKAAFEAFITVRDEAETRKLARFAGALQGLEDRLPIDPRFRNPKLGGLAPIRVVNSLFSSGDGNRGVQTAAYNLPNDERITSAMGSKRVMLKNVQHAKFDRVLVPISRVALAPADQKDVAFDPFFTHILMHELMHGLGPHEITVGGNRTTVRAQLRDTYSAIEEAKADISGLWALQVLIDDGAVDKAMERTLYPTFLASAFRSIRFGLTEAHGKGVALQLDYLLDRGAFRVAKDGTFAVDTAKVKAAVTALTHDLLTIEAEGDRAAAVAMLEKLAVLRPEVKRVLDRLGGVPVDIAPRYVTAETLVGAP